MDSTIDEDFGYFTENEYYGYSGHDELHGKPRTTRMVGGYDPVKAQAVFNEQLKRMSADHLAELKRLKRMLKGVKIINGRLTR